MNKKTILMSIFLFLLFCLPVMSVYAEGDITVDGNSDDWEALGLEPEAIDASNNIESYHDTCADLLEGWVYNSSDNLYLMIKVRGGYPENWNTTSYLIFIDADNNETTGNDLGWDYSVYGSDGSAIVMKWDDELSDWGDEKWIQVTAGNTGYVEFEVPLDAVDLSEEINLLYGTYDDVREETVNTVRVNNVSVIPEYPLFLVLLVPMSAGALLIAIIQKRKCKQK